MIAKLSWRNLWRNKTRSLITVTSISFAVLLAVLMQSFQKGVFDHLVKNVVSFYTGYIQVHKSGYWKEKILDNGFLLNDSFQNKITRLPGVKGIVPRLESFMLVSGGSFTKGCMVVGTVPALENQLTGLQEKITAGKYLEANDRSVIIAEGLAGKLKLKTDDTLIILGQGYQGSMAAGKYPIKGLIHFGSPELNDGFVYMPLQLAQELLSAENLLTSIVLDISDPLQMESIQNNIISLSGEGYETMNWKELLPEISNHIKADGASLSIFTGILYFIIGFGIFGTILMMSVERKQEFGMLIAIGMKKVKLSLMLIQETLLISLIGVLIGILLSLPLILYLHLNPIRLGGQIAKVYEQFGFEPYFPTSIEPGIFLQQSTFVLIIAALLGLYPLWYIHKLNPVQAMKR